MWQSFRRKSRTSQAELGGYTVVSQWGEDGEYFHVVDDVFPILGEAREAGRIGFSGWHMDDLLPTG